MYIMQINKIYKDRLCIKESDLIDSRCRLIEYKDLNEIDNHILQNTREVYRDNYTLGNLCPIYPDILYRYVNEDTLIYKIRLYNGNLLKIKFIKIDMQ